MIQLIILVKIYEFLLKLLRKLFIWAIYNIYTLLFILLLSLLFAYVVIPLTTYFPTINLLEHISAIKHVKVVIISTILFIFLYTLKPSIKYWRKYQNSTKSNIPRLYVPDIVILFILFVFIFLYIDIPETITAIISNNQNIIFISLSVLLIWFAIGFYNEYLQRIIKNTWLIKSRNPDKESMNGFLTNKSSSSSSIPSSGIGNLFKFILLSNSLSGFLDLISHVFFIILCKYSL